MPLIALMFQAPLFAHPVADVRRCSPRARWGSPPSGRCSPRCSSAPAAATSCCRCCCIRSRFRSSSRACAAPPRCCRPTSICRWRALVAVDAGVLRRRVRHARAVDVRAGHDGMSTGSGSGARDPAPKPEPGTRTGNRGTLEPEPGNPEPGTWNPCNAEPPLSRSRPRRRRDVRLRARADHPGAVRVDDGAGAEDLLLPRAVVDGDVHGGVRVRDRRRRVPVHRAARGGPAGGRGGGARRRCSG